MTQPTTKRLITEAAMDARQSIATAEVALSSSAAETLLFGPTVLANTPKVASTYRLTAGGRIDNQATSGTLTFRLRWGGAAGTLLGSWVIPSQAGAATGQQFWLDSLLTFRTVGATGTAAPNGFGTSVFGPSTLAFGGSLVTALDTTVNKVLALTAQWATSSATNLLRFEVGVFEIVRA